MRGWLLRGLNMAVLWGVVQTVYAKLSVGGGASTAATVGAFAIPVAAGLVWGAVDTWTQRAERGSLWLKACLVAGLFGALLGVAGQALFVDNTGAWAIGPALVGPAPFLALAVLASAAVGMGLGRLFAPRPVRERPVRERAVRERAAGTSTGAPVRARRPGR